MKITIKIRLPKDDKFYYKHRLESFAELFSEKEITRIEFGKQDIRGTESITLIDKNHCVPVQKHFYNKWELLGFVDGFLNHKENKWSTLWRFLK